MLSLMRHYRSVPLEARDAITPDAQMFIPISPDVIRRYLPRMSGLRRSARGTCPALAPADHGNHEA